jgi:AraC family transcriptional regulator
MERAKELLLSTASVTDTAIAVGYANLAKFSAAFRRWVGSSPSLWRRQY